MSDRPVSADPAARIGGLNQVNSIIGAVLAEFELGNAIDHAVINRGYEDCNVRLDTDTGSYLIKMFSATRRPGVAERTLALLQQAIAAGVRHPRLISHRKHPTRYLHPIGPVRILVMEFLLGADFYTLGRAPELEELRSVIEQISRLHSVQIRPPWIDDPWAVQNLSRLYKSVARYLDPDERTQVEAATRAMAVVDHDALPIRLVHGDLTKGNVLRSAGGDIYLIDFAVANAYPRIQEIAVIGANLMHRSPLPLIERVELLCDLYSEHAPLSEVERSAARHYAIAAAAMELLGARQQMVHDGDHCTETNEVLEIGRAGLRTGIPYLERTHPAG